MSLESQEGTAEFYARIQDERKDAVRTALQRIPECKVRAAAIVEVIRVEFIRGKGIGDDPVRAVTQYWHKDGTMICEVDPYR